jgi:hypothetical protein
LTEQVTIKKTTTSTENKKKLAKKTINALSFDNEEGDAEEFQIKKTKTTKLKLPTK